MNTPLQHAVWAVIARWDSPAWKDMPHTGEYIDAMRKALADEQAQTTHITPLMEQQMFDDWCPYKGNPDPRTVWAAAIDAANGLTLGATAYPEQAQAVEPLLWVRKDQLNQMASGFLLSAYRSTEGRTDLTPVFAHPAPPPAETMKNGAHRWIDLDLLGAIAGALSHSKNAPIILSKVRGLIKMVGGVGRGPDAPYPGMIEAFEVHYGQSFTDKDWRNEAGIWAAAWGCAVRHPAPPAKAQQVAVLADIEQYRMQMAGISTAALGYWSEGNDIHPDYDTTALRDVARLYVKYDQLFKEKEERRAQQVAVPVPMTDVKIYAVARNHPKIGTLVPHLDVRQFARAIEAHHKIGKKP